MYCFPNEPVPPVIRIVELLNTGWLFSVKSLNARLISGKGPVNLCQSNQRRLILHASNIQWNRVIEKRGHRIILEADRDCRLVIQTSLEKTDPVGLQGEEKMIAFVLDVMDFSNCAAVTLKSFSIPPLTNTGVPSANLTMAS